MGMYPTSHLVTAGISSSPPPPVTYRLSRKSSEYNKWSHWSHQSNQYNKDLGTWQCCCNYVRNRKCQTFRQVVNQSTIYPHYLVNGKTESVHLKLHNGFGKWGRSNLNQSVCKLTSGSNNFTFCQFSFQKCRTPDSFFSTLFMHLAETKWDSYLNNPRGKKETASCCC